MEQQVLKSCLITLLFGGWFKVILSKLIYNAISHNILIMSVSNILILSGANAGKIKPELIVGGGAGVVDSVSATAGIHIDNTDVANPIVQIGTNQAGDLIVGTATQFVGAVLNQGANGIYLGVNNAGVLGYSVPPTQGIPFTAGGQMLYAGGSWNPCIIKKRNDTNTTWI